MNSTNTEQLPNPWYKEFWPWFILSLLGSTILACIVTIILAIGSAEPVLGHVPQVIRAIMG